MTSALEGEGGPQKADERNEVAGLMYVTSGERVKKSKHFADVMYRSPLMQLQSAPWIKCT